MADIKEIREIRKNIEDKSLNEIEYLITDSEDPIIEKAMATMRAKYESVAEQTEFLVAKLEEAKNEGKRLNDEQWMIIKKRLVELNLIPASWLVDMQGNSLYYNKRGQIIRQTKEQSGVEILKSLLGQ